MLAHAVHGDVAAQRGQPLGKGAPQPAAGARDERDLAFEQALGHVCCIPLEVRNTVHQSSASVNPTARLCARHMGATMVRSAASGMSGISNTTVGALRRCGLSRLSVMATAGTPRATSSGNSRAVSGL